MTYQNQVVIVDGSGVGEVGPRPARPRDVGKQGHGSRALGRALRRAAGGEPSHYSSYAGARSNRLNRDWVAQAISGDAAAWQAAETLAARARDLVRNDAWARAARDKIVANVIGEQGILTEGAVETGPAADDPQTVELDETTNAQADDVFAHWAEDYADAEGQLSWAEIQSLAMGEAIEVGESFLVATNRPGRERPVPLAFQLLEAEQLCTQLDRPAGQNQNEIRRGIEFDSFGSPVAYWFYKSHPNGVWTQGAAWLDDLARIPAARVLHYFEKNRPSLTRGISWFAPILQALRDLGEYLGDEMTAARVSALFTVAIKRENGGGGLGLESDDGSDGYDDDGNRLTHLGAGIIGEIGANDSIETINTTRPNPNAKTWVDLILTQLAAGIGLSYIGLTGDVSAASYSSARAARLQDKRFFTTIQNRFARRIVLPVRRGVLSQAYALGRVPEVSPQTFAANRRRWLATAVLPPGWEEIDAPKEIAASLERIKAGLSTLQIECAGRGRNWIRILRQRAIERKTAERLGVQLSVDAAAAGVVPAAREAPLPDPEA